MMGQKKTMSVRDMKKILNENGYKYIRCKGDHFIYSNGVNTIVINRNLNRMVAERLIKENNLVWKK